MAAPNADKPGVMIAEAVKHSKAEYCSSNTPTQLLSAGANTMSPLSERPAPLNLAAAVSFVLMSTHENAFVALVYMPMQPAL